MLDRGLIVGALAAAVTGFVLDGAASALPLSAAMVLLLVWVWRHRSIGTGAYYFGESGTSPGGQVGTDGGHHHGAGHHGGGDGGSFGGFDFGGGGHGGGHGG